MLIGLSGKKQVGKDTACEIIKKLTIVQYAHNMFEKHAFADKLKQCAAIILGCKVERFEDNTFKDSATWIPNQGSPDPYLTGRQILQKLGTEVGRNIHPDIWVEALLRDYRYRWTHNMTNCDNPLILPNWIVPDVRFLSEVKAIEGRGGFVIRINRDTSYSDSHPSEIGLDDYPFKYVVNNNGTLDELKDKLSNILHTELVI